MRVPRPTTVSPWPAPAGADRGRPGDTRPDRRRGDAKLTVPLLHGDPRGQERGPGRRALLAGDSRPAAVDGSDAAAAFTTPRLATLNRPSASSTSRISGRSSLSSPNSRRPPSRGRRRSGQESALQRDEGLGPEARVLGDLQAVQLDPRHRQQTHGHRGEAHRAAEGLTRVRRGECLDPRKIQEVRQGEDDGQDQGGERRRPDPDPEGEPLHSSPDRRPTRSGWP